MQKFALTFYFTAVYEPYRRKNMRRNIPSFLMERYENISTILAVASIILYIIARRVIENKINSIAESDTKLEKGLKKFSKPISVILSILISGIFFRILSHLLIWYS